MRAQVDGDKFVNKEIHNMRKGIYAISNKRMDISYIHTHTHTQMEISVYIHVRARINISVLYESVTSFLTDLPLITCTLTLAFSATVGTQL